MPSIAVDVTGARRLFDASPAALARAVTAWRLQVGPYVVGQMRKVIRDRVRRSGAGSGQTAMSVRVQASGPDYVVVGPTKRETPWGTFDPIWVDQPTRPHEIRPRFKKVLAFSSLGGSMAQRGGRFVGLVRIGKTGSGRPRVVQSELQYASVVHHPGTRGLFFIDATRDAVERPVQELLDAKVRDELEALKRAGAL